MTTRRDFLRGGAAAGVVFCSCGSRENPGNINSNHEALDQAGVKNTAYVSPDTAHEFLTWRRPRRLGSRRHFWKQSIASRTIAIMRSRTDRVSASRLLTS